MFKSFYLVVFLVFVFAGCSTTPPLQPIDIYATKVTIDYNQDIKPILDKRCVSCHSCYNSPCQLKLSSYEGLDRGTSKDLVYLAERLSAQDSSRLFIDAQNTQEWRKKGFSSVTSSDSVDGTNNSIMLQLLAHKMKNPKSIGEYHAEEDTTCAKNVQELADFLDKHPNQGMPYGFPALSRKEYNLLNQWLYQGAKGPIKTPIVKLPIIQRFEDFLNENDAKHKMSARYIYEHLFLAHLSFDKESKDFYELVRSYTPSPEPIDIVATLRPYDDPKASIFYYRFRKITSTIVHKTHMVYDLNEAKLKRYKELFIEPQWNEKPYEVGFKTSFNAEPFKVFAQIPARSRYLFLLDNSEYIIRTFIRGPVCKGQIALNVIHDNFWVMFMNPEYDLSLKGTDFISHEYKNLRMPIENGSDSGLISSFRDTYINLAQSYQKYRSDIYDKYYENGLGVDSVYKGNNHRDSAPFLTVYRHFDSASVHFGALGNLPRTVWLIDYPLFERIYYALVAGFDIYGNAGHQVSIRRYMNRLRVEGEVNFLNLLPIKERQDIFNSWYIGSQDDEIAYFSKRDADFHYKKLNAKRELIDTIVKQHLQKSYNIKFDSVNYYTEDERPTVLPNEFKENKDYVKAFRSLSREGTGFIKHANGVNSNLAYLRIKVPNAKDIVVSMVINRWHNNVSFMFDEESRLDPSKDKIDFIQGFVGSYPNYFFVVQPQ